MRGNDGLIGTAGFGLRDAHQDSHDGSPLVVVSISPVPATGGSYTTSLTGDNPQMRVLSPASHKKPNPRLGAKVGVWPGFLELAEPASSYQSEFIGLADKRGDRVHTVWLVYWPG